MDLEAEPYLESVLYDPVGESVGDQELVGRRENNLEAGMESVLGDETPGPEVVLAVNQHELDLVRGL